jgi:hypothetical protein
MLTKMSSMLDHHVAKCHVRDEIRVYRDHGATWAYALGLLNL